MTQAARPEWIEQLLTPCILQRDEVGFGSHQAIPNSFDESTNCIAEFAKYGVQLRPVSAEDDLLEADLEEMNAKGDWRTWCPIPPTPDNAWRLIAVFDTDDGPPRLVDSPRAAHAELHRLRSTARLCASGGCSADSRRVAPA